ncbi:MAG: PmoA family protein [Gemmataceae bacterium]
MPKPIPRCQVLPLPDHQASFQVEGRERLRWHFGPSYPRPFFYPLIGPSGQPLTRMGHPGAPDHDHHRSVWFAHQKVQGVNFWEDRTPARIRQKAWVCYQDGDTECVMAATLVWYDGHDPKELLEQELIAAVRPGDRGETLVELQSTFRPTAESLEFGKTNFGFLAVRVAKSISGSFGGGRLTSSNGQTGEPAVFGKPAAWMDYSGPVPGELLGGITYFDHPANPGSPVSWHVREDGWMGAAVCLNGPMATTKKSPLALRYLLHAHAGPVNADAAAYVSRRFEQLAPYEVTRSSAKHTQFDVRRKG